MTLRDLEYVVAVADAGHFGRAAEACHVSQPTLSGQIRKLEERLGVTLFERTSRRVRVTAIGVEVVQSARRALSASSEVAHLAQSARDPFVGPLALGMIPTIAPTLLPVLAARVAARWPRLQPVFVEAETATLLRRLERGELDGIIVATAPPSASFAEISLYREQFYLAIPVQHPLARVERPTLQSVPRGELLLLADGHCLRDQALALCGAPASADAAVGDARATSLETLLNLVAAGMGITLVPERARRPLPGVVYREPRDPGAYREVRMVCRRGYPRKEVLEEIANA